MNAIDFECILKRTESPVLDFKKKMYDFVDDADLSKTAKFVKDIVSFTNTIRKETSYIVIGVEEDSSGQKIFHGIDNIIDDSILQDKIKNKVNPLPYFNFFTIDFNSKTYGIFEFPLRAYSGPIMPTVKLKGLDIGQVYHRHGSSNAGARGDEVIKISEWLKGITDFNLDNNRDIQLNSILNKTTLKEIKLSVIITELLVISKRYKIDDLISFCKLEIRGIPKEIVDAYPELYKYRLVNVKISSPDVVIDPTYYSLNIDYLKEDIENSNCFIDQKIVMCSSILEIEQYIEDLRVNFFRLFKNK